jgi:hypothetical protein
MLRDSPGSHPDMVARCGLDLTSRLGSNASKLLSVVDEVLAEASQGRSVSSGDSGEPRPADRARVGVRQGTARLASHGDPRRDAPQVRRATRPRRGEDQSGTLPALPAARRRVPLARPPCRPRHGPRGLRHG